jgi:hypothetical protein
MVAVTAYVPPTPLAVGIGDVATPLVFVTALTLAEVPNDALAPLVGAVKATVTPLTGLWFASATVACKAFVKAVLRVVFWGVPPLAATLRFKTERAAPFKSIFPLPAVETQLTFRAWLAVPALYSSV